MPEEITTINKKLNAIPWSSQDSEESLETSPT